MTSPPRAERRLAAEAAPPARSSSMDTIARELALHAAAMPESGMIKPKARPLPGLLLQLTSVQATLTGASKGMASPGPQTSSSSPEDPCTAASGRSCAERRGCRLALALIKAQSGLELESARRRKASKMAAAGCDNSFDCGCSAGAKSWRARSVKEPWLTASTTSSSRDVTTAAAAPDMLHAAADECGGCAAAISIALEHAARGGSESRGGGGDGST